MILKGLQKTTLIDFPGHLACTVFTYGCNFKCPFCHNPELVLAGNTDPDLKEEDFWHFLGSRQGLLEGVCITGGEPTLHPDLPDFISKIKKLGFKVKLDTNGTNPEMLQALMQDKLLDYIAMDVKNNLKDYAKTAGRHELNLEQIKASIALILDSGLDYEFRTTVVVGLHDELNLQGIGELIEGAGKFVIQNFRPGKTLDPSLTDRQPFLDKQLQKFQKIMEKYVKKVELR